MNNWYKSTVDEVQNIMLKIRNRQKNVLYHSIHMKFSDRQKLFIVWVKGLKEQFWDVKSYILDWSCSYIGVYICPNLSNFHLKWDNFTVCKLHHNKVTLKSHIMKNLWLCFNSFMFIICPQSLPWYNITHFSIFIPSTTTRYWQVEPLFSW